jgi:hypothetical protein
VFTTRCALSPYIKRIRFVFKRLRNLLRLLRTYPQVPLLFPFLTRILEIAYLSTNDFPSCLAIVSSTTTFQLYDARIAYWWLVVDNVRQKNINSTWPLTALTSHLPCIPSQTTHFCLRQSIS